MYINGYIRSYELLITDIECLEYCYEVGYVLMLSTYILAPTGATRATSYASNRIESFLYKLNNCSYTFVTT